MACIWAFSEDAALTTRLVGLARSLADGPSVAVGAVTLDAAAAPLLKAAGADTVYVLAGANSWPESYAPALAKLCTEHKPELVLVAATLRGKEIAATVAAHVRSGLVSEAFAIRRGPTGFETDRLMYGGLAVCTEILNGMTLVTVPAANYEAPEPDLSHAAEVVTVSADTAGRAVVGEVCPVQRGGADITAAERVVCVGRGFGKQEDLKLAENLAEVIGGTVGCTRSIAEDYGWMPEETYIGLSGRKIRPKLYVSLGVSGQVQHVAGIRDSKIIVGVDTNENAPIFAAADYGIVGDLYEVAPLLTAALKARNG
jgi:electron transfer flavoprotein alpha subunit